MSDAPEFAFKVEDLIKSGRTTRSTVEEIKKWLTLHPEFPFMTDEQVALFLLSCNNAIEATKTTIECYFKHKAAAPEIFKNRQVDSEEVQFTLGVTSFAQIPKRTKENYAILMTSLKDTYHNNFHTAQHAKMGFLAIDAMVHSNPPNGLIILINVKGVGLMHLTRLKIDTIKKIVSYLQEALPTQLKQVHILNSSYIFDKVLFLFKPFMKKELYESIITHPVNASMEDFFEKYVPASCMPSDFGGELPTLEELQEIFEKECRNMKSFLDADERQIQRYIDNVKGC